MITHRIIAQAKRGVFAGEAVGSGENRFAGEASEIRTVGPSL
jgi:hypothetical protein